MFASSLPPELWLHIFRWATISPLTASLRTTAYTPFGTASIDSHDEALCTKRALVCVCKQWRRLSLDLLYEDVRMKRPETFPETLASESGVDHRGYRRWVRRAYLPFSGSATTSSSPLRAVEILNECPQLETLVRMGPFSTDSYNQMRMRFEFEADCPALPSLKRLDWWHHNEAHATGGINSLADVLQAAPNVQYLSLGGEVWLSFLHSALVSLPCLTTIRIMPMNVLFAQQICRWSLPALEHVIVDRATNIGTLTTFWETYGEQLRSVEFGADLKYYMYDVISFVLPSCRNMEELNYYVNFTATPAPLREPHRALTTVGLHAQENCLVPLGSEAFWEHLEQHLSVLDEDSFPALSRVALHGDWSSVVHDEQFARLVKPLRERGCAVELSTN